ncbi:hypothetical protein OTU49_005096, partial [Cherax quadricarinatus]
LYKVPTKMKKFTLFVCAILVLCGLSLIVRHVYRQILRSQKLEKETLEKSIIAFGIYDFNLLMNNNKDEVFECSTWIVEIPVAGLVYESWCLGKQLEVLRRRMEHLNHIRILITTKITHLLITGFILTMVYAIYQAVKIILTARTQLSSPVFPLERPALIAPGSSPHLALEPPPLLAIGPPPLLALEPPPLLALGPPPLLALGPPPFLPLGPLPLFALELTTPTKYQFNFHPILSELLALTPLKALPLALPLTKTLPLALPPPKPLPLALLPPKTLSLALPPAKTLPLALPPPKTLSLAPPPNKTLPLALPPPKILPLALPPPKALPLALPPPKALPLALPPPKTLPLALPPPKTLPLSLPSPKTLPLSLPPPVTLPLALPPSKSLPAALPTPETLPLALPAPETHQLAPFPPPTFSLDQQYPQFVFICSKWFPLETNPQHQTIANQAQHTPQNNLLDKAKQNRLEKMILKKECFQKNKESWKRMKKEQQYSRRTWMPSKSVNRIREQKQVNRKQRK